jgi:hypothetical protein
VHETLKLPGRWGIDNNQALGFRDNWSKLVAPIPVEVELGASQGNSTVAVVDFPYASPETFVTKQATQTSQQGQNTSGQLVSISSGRVLSIGGLHAAEVSVRVQSASGDAAALRREYYIATGSTVTIVVVESTEPTLNAQSYAVNQVEAALMAMKPEVLGG